MSAGSLNIAERVNIPLVPWCAMIDEDEDEKCLVESV